MILKLFKFFLLTNSLRASVSARLFQLLGAETRIC